MLAHVLSIHTGTINVCGVPSYMYVPSSGTAQFQLPVVIVHSKYYEYIHGIMNTLIVVPVLAYVLVAE